MDRAKGGGGRVNGIPLAVKLSISSLLIFLLWVWCRLAIYYSNLPGGTLRTVAAALFGIGFPVAFVVCRNRQKTAIWVFAAFLVVLVWFWLIPPSHDRDWEPSVAVLPRATPEQARTLFLSSIARVNQMYARPEFYNTIVQNCSTSLAPHVERLNLQSVIDKWRLLLNGYSDEMAYDNGWIDSDLSFAETKARHYINQYVRNDPEAVDFSRRIRSHLNTQ